MELDENRCLEDRSWVERFWRRARIMKKKVSPTCSLFTDDTIFVGWSGEVTE